MQRFEHGGIVTSVDFHPVHDRYFIQGVSMERFGLGRNFQFDRGLYSGSICGEDDGGVTCVKFSPDGGKIVAGFSVVK